MNNSYFQGYDNTTRLLNHNISLTIELEEVEGDFF